jgi:nitrogen fixation NifU-like protein
MSEDPQKQDLQGYSPIVIEHAQNPRNVGVIPNPDGYASAIGSCGDIMEICLKMNGDRIQQATFSTTGCGPTVAALSFTTELARGKSIAEIKKITPEYVLNALGGLPEENIECAVLAVQILREAIKDYLAFKNEPWKRAYRQQRY